jgi:outer membrane protein OmpA-like peptidoglycan-associated protein
MRRTAVVAGVLGFGFAVSGPAARAEPSPDVPDARLRESILPLSTGDAVYDIELPASVTPLEEEKNQGGTVTVRISSDVLFDFGRATLTDGARREIGEVAARLRGTTGAVRVSGHSDGIGPPAYNLTLSRERAGAVRAELLRRLSGVRLRITAEGYGETRPVEPDSIGAKDNLDGRARNRRVEITFRTS